MRLAASKFECELQTLINQHSQENGSNTPDFILAQYLAGCLEVWNECTRKREAWHGRDPNAGPAQARVESLSPSLCATATPPADQARGGGDAVPEPTIPLCLNCQYDVEFESGEPDRDCSGCRQLREVWAMGWNAGQRWIRDIKQPPDPDYVPGWEP